MQAICYSKRNVKIFKLKIILNNLNYKINDVQYRA